MKIFKPIVIVILGLIFLSLFFGSFFILIKSVEKKPKELPQNTQENEHKLIRGHKN